MATQPFDVVTIGRVSVDVYPLQIGVGLQDVQTFGKFLGGSPTNVAVAAARHGRRCSVITRTGADPFGLFIHAALQDLGVDDSQVHDVAHLATPVVFCEIFPPDNFPLYFYRQPTAPDMQIRADDLDLDGIASAGILWLTLTGLSEEPSRTAHLKALDARGGRTHTIIDLDYRQMFWTSAAAARRQVGPVLDRCTVAIGNLEEVHTAVGERDPYAAARALLAAGVKIAIVKLGPAGVLGMTASQVVEVPPHPVKVVNGLGAGDGFGGAVCHGLLAGWDLQHTLQFANVAGAIVASRLECSTAMPTTAEVQAAMQG
ncbi:MAG: 5-dehydro-2-deoxygluconokinase, partial [Euzebya sp.]